MKNKKAVYIILGCIGVGLGAIGAVVPMIPAFPFLLLAAHSFSRSSEKMNRWFMSTKLYKNNLESYVQGKGMTRRAKIRVMTIITLFMSFGFIMMSNVPIGRAILSIIWLFHIIYFIVGVKTIKFEPRN